MRFDANSKLWSKNIRNGTKYRNPEETEEGTVQDSSKDTSSSGVLMESVRTFSGLRPKSSTAWPKKEKFSHLGSSGK